MMENFDVVVVGFGVFGSVVVWQVFCKGVKVVVFEQYEFGYVCGVFYDIFCIVWIVYDVLEYVLFVKVVYKDWVELEKDVGVKLLMVIGGIVVFVNECGWMFGVKFMDYIVSLEVNDVFYEFFDVQEVKE